MRGVGYFMGKPAARAIIDQGAHTGPITSGSFNVLIGGKPAARKGDPITCSAHGVASIIEGSSSVFINGIPAARMGDKTSCGTPPAPKPEGPKPAEDNVTYWSPALDFDKNTGLVKTPYSPENLAVKPLYAYAGTKDKTGNGDRDQAVAGFGMLDIQAKSDEWTPFGKKYGGVGGSLGMSVLKADALAGAYASNGIYGLEANAKGTVQSYNAEAHIGREDVLYAKGEGKADIGYAEAGADAEGYWGGEKSRYGFNLSGVAEAGLARASIGGAGDFMGIKIGNNRGDETHKNTGGEWEKKAGGKKGGTYIEGKIGGVGGDIGLGGYLDTDDYEVNIKAKLGAELGLGLEIGVDITLTAKPWIEIWDSLFPSQIEGKIITGFNTVIIG